MVYQTGNFRPLLNLTEAKNKQNQVIEGNVSTAIRFYRNVPVPLVAGHQPNLKFTDELLACDLDDAPDFKWKNPASVYRICTLTSNLHGISLKRFRKHTNSLGVQYYHIEFQLQISLVDEVCITTMPYSYCILTIAGFEIRTFV